MSNYIPIQKLNSFNDKQTKLINYFQSKFNQKPKFIVTVPGRCNLVGEHVDYSGFPVISMAIEQNISIAVNYEKYSKKLNKSEFNFNEINLSNTDHTIYQDYKFTNTNSLDNLIKPEWFHYVICGYKGILEEIENFIQNQNILNRLKEIINSYTINLMVTGDIPHSSGLSSSSALVVASSIVFRFCIGLILEEFNEIENEFCKNELDEILNINKHHMACSTAFYERHIGTQGGGIDQAIQLLAEDNTAKLIKFKPKLDAFNVELPKDSNFFVIHCGRTLNKASTVDYNVRVFETRIAAQLLKQEKSRSNNFQSIDSKVLLSDFETLDKENPYADLIEQINSLFKETNGRFTIEEIKKLLNTSTNELLSKKIEFPLKSLDLIIESRGLDFKFNIMNRALHVYNEVNRVLKMQSIDPNIDNNNKIELIGKLLNESHESLKNLFECSCDELDYLVNLSNLYGGKGAKLTGAGWGGCLVSVVPKDKVENFEKEIALHSNKFIIKTKPSKGSIIYRI